MVSIFDKFSLKGKCALVTGGNRGIGLEVSRAFAEAGSMVAILHRSSKEADSIAASLAQETNVHVRAFQCNINSQQECKTVFNKVLEEFKTIDIVVVNAGVGEAFAAEDGTEDQCRRMIDTNLNGAFFTAQAAAEIFKLSGKGNIIFTASISAILVNTPQKQAIYNASKAGLVQLARSLAVEWADFCRVNCISPGYVETDMTAVLPQEWQKEWLKQIPMKRMCKPEELKTFYVFCASDASSYMTGANLVVDGGLSLC